MNISLNINHLYQFGFCTQWRLFGPTHGKPSQVHAGFPHTLCFFYGWFYYVRPADYGDSLLWHIKIDRLKSFLDWSSCIDIDDYVSKNQQWISKRNLKKIRKYQKKLSKIATYRKDFGVKK